MDGSRHERRLQQAQSFSRAAGLTVAAVGAIALAGWAVDSVALKTLFLRPPVTVKTNAAICFVCGGMALWLLATPRASALRSRTARVLAVIVIALGSLTFSEHIVGWDLAIDQLLFEEAPGAMATVSPNRMGPPASLSLTLMGLSLLLLDASTPRARRWREGLALFCTVIALLPIIGYASGVSPLFAVARLTGIALITALSLILLATGILASRPDHRIVRLLCADDEAGRIMRQLTVPAFVLPLLAGTVLTRGMQGEWYDGAFAVSALALVLMVSLTAVIWLVGANLSAALAARDAAESTRQHREDELRAANRRQTEFLAVLSHELRNPLAPMRFAVEMMPDDEGAGRSSPKGVMRRQLAHMVHLVDDLLDLTRVTSGKIQLRLRRVDLKLVLEHAIEAAQPELGVGGHEIAVTSPPEPLWVEADPERLAQVITNLLSNAARYTPSPGRITLEASASEHEATISVRDTGIGLKSGDLERVFQMFTQLGKAGAGGLGIGLALVKAIVELHGGHVEARSEGLGHGSEFQVRLRRAPGPATEIEAREVAASRGPRRRVLVVDDNEDSAELIRTLLQIDGHEVRVAHDGPSALQEMAAFTPDVGVFDIGMPGMDGYELATRVRGEGRPMYLIAVTGWGQATDRHRARATGFNAHLTKPANPTELRRLVAHATLDGLSGRE